MAPTIIPAPKFIMVRPIKSGEKTSNGGVIIPEAASDDRDSTLLEGAVIAVGEDVNQSSGAFGSSVPVPFKIDVGATVLYARYAGFTRHTDEGQIKFLQRDDIAGILSED